MTMPHRRDDPPVRTGPARPMSDVPKRVPPIEKVRLRKLTTADGAAYVGVELEYRVDPDEPVRLAFGLTPGDAVELGMHLRQLGEKLESTEH